MQQERLREWAFDIFKAAVTACDPYRLVQAHCQSVVDAYYQDQCQKLFLASFGKAAFAMTRALTESPLRSLITRGVLITKYGHVPGALDEVIEICEAGHPVPDEKGTAATKRVLDLIAKADRRTLVICLISGGGSALLAAPCQGVSLDEKRQVTELLLKAGATITELNCVRKHISSVKGGRLAEIAYPSRVLSLILSDVIGDPLDVVASGPTSPDKTTFGDALAVLERYKLTDAIPAGVLTRLVEGSEGQIAETPKEGNPAFDRVENRIIGSNKLAAEAAAGRARQLGFEPIVLSTQMQGEARSVASILAQKAVETRKGHPPDKRICLISGGETTVTVKGTGRGGRNTELALAFAKEIAGSRGIVLLSAGTDGTDGPTDAAGAVVDGQTCSNATAKGLSLDHYLNNNDSYSFFKSTGELLITGATGTNVMDLQIILLT